jgi:hypothetical protein
VPRPQYRTAAMSQRRTADRMSITGGFCGSSVSTGRAAEGLCAAGWWGRSAAGGGAAMHTNIEASTTNQRPARGPLWPVCQPRRPAFAQETAGSAGGQRFSRTRRSHIGRRAGLLAAVVRLSLSPLVERDYRSALQVHPDPSRAKLIVRTRCAPRSWPAPRAFRLLSSRQARNAWRRCRGL